MQRSICKRITWLICMSVFSLAAIGQDNVFYDDCECSTDGESFEQRFSLEGLPFQDWELISTTNFFESVGPYTDFFDGTSLSLVALTNDEYEISGFRIAGVETVITVSNGTDNFTYRFPETCVYPEVTGDQFVCEGSGLAVYSVEDLTNIVWSAPGLNLLGGVNSDNVSVNWSAESVGNYIISATGDYELGANSCPVVLNFPVELAKNGIAEQLACNNAINLSLDGSCELRIVADMILEGNDVVNDAYDITVRLEENGEAIPNEMITMQYLGVPLIVEVSQQCGGNSCWGTLVVDDTTAPPLYCPMDITLSCEEMLNPVNSGLPIPMDVTPIQIDDNSYLLEDFDFCGDAVLSYYDELVDNSLCEGPFASIVERIWVLTDVNGNKSSCSHFISVERADLLDVIVWPPNYDSVLPDALDPLLACGTWPALDDGHPSPEHTGYPIGTFCSNVQVTFEDTPLEKCGHSSIKIIRRWEVRDICGDGDDVIVYNQYITTVDEVAPDLKEYTEEMIVQAEGHYCISDIVVPAPELNSPECSYWDYYVGYKFVDNSNDPFEGLSTDGIVYDNNLGLYVIENIPAENQQVWVVYIAEDECGNVSTTNIEVRAVDIEEPVPVCDLNTYIGLNEYGISHAGVYTFDDGSWDNCSLSHLEVRRMDGAPCDAGTADFSDNVHFCCDDVGKTLQVQLRAYDFAGNHNDCMVNVFVQDNIAPKLISCPSDRNISCDVDIENLPLYGSPVFTDECYFEWTHLDEIITEAECGTGGIVRRTFTAEDKGGNRTSCVQILTLINFSPFTFNSINWPNDLDSYEGCYGEDIKPENLPAGHDEPKYNDGPCDQIGHNYTDVVFEDTEEACLKVLRKWKVVNNCTYESWERTQIIKLVNSQGPVIDCSDVEIEDNDPFACGAIVTATAEATDDCTAVDDLKWTYIINGNANWSGTSNYFEQEFEQGSYQVRWTAMDECGNTTECFTDFNVEDTKPPTPLCLEFLITTIRETQETSEIWASDFIKDGYDDCSDASNLIYSFSENVNDRTRVYNCDDIENGVVDSLEVLVWVTDESGNQDYCTSILILQDNADNCPDAVDEEEEDDDNSDDDDEDEDLRVSIAGQIYLEDQSVMPEVMLHLVSTEFIHNTQIATGEQGDFAFTELDMYLDYNLTPSYEGNYLDGVSTLDLVMIQKHVLGIQMLDSPYKIIAADANNSESVTSIDLIELRKLILGIYDELPNNKSWRFVDQSTPIVDLNSPFPLNEEMDFQSLESDYMDSDFIAVKVGDVNNTLQNLAGNQIENRSEVFRHFAVDDITMEAGSVYELDIRSESEEEIEGFQMSVSFEDLELVELKPGVLNISDSNVHQHETGLNISWHGVNVGSVNQDDILFSLVVKAKDVNSTSKAFYASNSLKSEIYVNNGSQTEVYNLSMRVHADDQSIFALHQNVPNPFNTETTVSFTLPTSQKAEIIITDYTGRLVYSHIDEFEAGLNQFQINSDDLNTSGILYLKLKTNTHSGTQKMLLIK